MVYRHIYIYIYLFIIWCKHAGSRTVSEMITDGPFLVSSHHSSPRCKFMRFLRKVWAQAGTWWHLSCACFGKNQKRWSCRDGLAEELVVATSSLCFLDFTLKLASGRTYLVGLIRFESRALNQHGYAVYYVEDGPFTILRFPISS